MLPNPALQLVHFLEQPIYYVLLVVDLGLEDGIVPGLVDNRYISTLLDQQFHAIQVSVERRPMEWCVPGLVDGIDVRQGLCGRLI